MKDQQTTSLPDAIAAAQRSTRFLSWTPGSSEPKEFTYGEGKPFTYQGWEITNQGETTRPLEKHYSSAEVAQIWGLSVDYVRELFRGEPDVLVLDRTGLNKYKTLRIPESVMIRVHRRHSQAKG